MAAEPVHGSLGRQTGPGRRLVERGEQRLVLQQVGVLSSIGDGSQLVADREDVLEFVPFELLERQDVASQETPHAVAPPPSISAARP
jgi:hypothetical protein